MFSLDEYCLNVYFPAALRFLFASYLSKLKPAYNKQRIKAFKID